MVKIGKNAKNSRYGLVWYGHEYGQYLFLCEELYKHRSPVKTDSKNIHRIKSYGQNKIGCQNFLCILAQFEAENMILLSNHNWYIDSLVLLSAGQVTSMCSSVPWTWLQVSALQYPFLVMLQCLVSMSVRKRPEAILAQAVLLEHSYTLLDAVIHT